MSLPTRQLGKNGPQVTALGFGLMGLSAFYGSFPSDEARFKVLDRAYELGEKFWDTADIYQDSEDLVGKWFARTGKRDEIFLASKFGNYREGGRRIVKGDRAYVKQACEKSLKRLGVDCIDLYYIHRVDVNVPIEETVGALAEFVKQGMIKYLGISECSADTLRRANAVHPIHAVQIEYSPFSLDIEKPEIDLLNTCRELGIAVVAYSPLGRGMLTSAYKSLDDFEEGDARRMMPRYSEENFPKNFQLVEKLSAIAGKKNITSGQLVLAWLMAQGEDIITIPGTKKIKYLEENIGALDVKLIPEEIKEIRELIESVEPAGERYPASMSSTLFADTPPLKE